MTPMHWSCFHHVRWRPDRHEFRRFAIAMWIGFGLIGAIQAARAGMGGATVALWTAGAVLGTAALVPGIGRFAYLAVHVPAAIVGFVISKVILFLLFAGLFVPIGLLLKLWKSDPLHLRWRDDLRLWRSCDTDPQPSNYYRQF